MILAMLAIMTFLTLVMAKVNIVEHRWFVLITVATRIVTSTA